MAPNPFSIGQAHQGIVLFCLALSAICIYAPCRWNYALLRPPDTTSVRRFLPYLYLLFALSLPVQVYKNYRYYQYIQEHGGYVYFFFNHEALAQSVPFLVRAIPIITIPVFLAIFTFEQRKIPLYITTILYFSTASIILIMGSRVAFFTTIITLWYVAQVKSQKRSRILRAVVLALVLLLVGDVVQNLREGDEGIGGSAPSLSEAVMTQGGSLDVTQVAIKYTDRFSPYVGLLPAARIGRIVRIE